MITKKIKFNSIKQVKDFCDKAGKYPFDMDIVCGRCMIDAKSIMGILSLSLNNSLELMINVDSENECQELLNDIDFLIQKK